MAAVTDSTKTEINVMIIGETGSGKSTLINYLTNLFYDGSLANLKIAIPTRYLKSNMPLVMPEHHEDCIDDITRRKTNQCTKYQYKIKEVYFNFFDTPGINDTGGYLADNENLDKIFQCIQSLEYLTSLVFVLNGTQARLTTNIKNVLERFHERIPDIFYSNIIVILTNCTSHTVNFNSIKLLNNPPIYHMQNSAFSSDPQTWSEQTLKILQHDWNISIQTMNEFIKTLVLLKSIPTNSLSDINNDRNIIRSILHESRLMILELQHIEDELIALEEASHIYSANIEKYIAENGTQTKSIQVNEITTTPYHNTLCLQCNIVCHERCSLSETTQIGEHVFRHCTVMNNGQCTRCPGQCAYNMHYHDRRLIKSVSRTLKTAISSLSNKYTEDKQNKDAYDIKCKTIKETKHLLEQLLQDQFNKVHNACIRVQNNCQGFNIANELYTFINLLKNDTNLIRSTSIIHKVNKLIGELEVLANDSSMILCKRSCAIATKQKKRTSKKANQIEVPTAIIDQTSHSQILDFSNNERYAEYTTEELIDLTRQLIENHTLIEKELHHRCEGTSIGYLSSTELVTLCEYYTSSYILEIDKLLALHSQLQQEIQEATVSDPYKILRAPIDKLIHLTAIKLCLQNVHKYQ
ncbi:unnamed protein product [Adineta steineri]|uniref:G domain-containing protein n=1 Tax=Adineta steineri TaxID=433720 RepID=A0A819D7L6_9BILA|nr:unnamed protein product [Adineta steineri]